MNNWVGKMAVLLAGAALAASALVAPRDELSPAAWERAWEMAAGIGMRTGEFPQADPTVAEIEALCREHGLDEARRVAVWDAGIPDGFGMPKQYRAALDYALCPASVETPVVGLEDLRAGDFLLTHWDVRADLGGIGAKAEMLSEKVRPFLFRIVKGGDQ